MTTTDTDTEILPLPAAARALLLEVLDLLYPPQAPQRHLGNAKDGAIAWQVQSALDDYADYAARLEAA